MWIEFGVPDFAISIEHNKKMMLEIREGWCVRYHRDINDWCMICTSVLYPTLRHNTEWQKYYETRRNTSSLTYSDIECILSTIRIVIATIWIFYLDSFFLVYMVGKCELKFGYRTLWSQPKHKKKGWYQRTGLVCVITATSTSNTRRGSSFLYPTSRHKNIPNDKSITRQKHVKLNITYWTYTLNNNFFINWFALFDVWNFERAFLWLDLWRLMVP